MALEPHQVIVCLGPSYSEMQVTRMQHRKPEYPEMPTNRTYLTRTKLSKLQLPLYQPDCQSVCTSVVELTYIRSRRGNRTGRGKRQFFFSTEAARVVGGSSSSYINYNSFPECLTSLPWLYLKRPKANAFS